MADETPGIVYVVTPPVGDPTHYHLDVDCQGITRSIHGATARDNDDVDDLELCMECEERDPPPATTKTQLRPDPETVTACPECDSTAVHSLNASNGGGYSCEACGAVFSELVERDREHNGVQPGHGTPLEGLSVRDVPALNDTEVGE